MKYKNYIENIFDNYKCVKKIDEYKTIPIYDGDTLIGFLKPLTYLYKVLRPQYIELICRWRQENEIGFTNRFYGTAKRTENWIDNVLLPRKDRILFMVHNIENYPIGHLGFSSFDFEEKSCEIDNVVRGVKGVSHGIMSLAMKALIEWGKRKLDLKEIYLRVVKDNVHAVEFYKRLNFQVIEEIPLYKTKADGLLIEWVEMKELDDMKPDKFHLRMKLNYE